MKLNEEAINEITYLLNEVKDVVRLLEEFGLNITSDPWQATSFNEEEDILTWSKENFENIYTIKNEDKFFIGGNVLTGHQHKYKNKWILAPKELAEVQGKIFEKYLKCIIKTISLKYFDLKLENKYGLINNCGWEHYLCITATVKQNALENDKTKTKKLIEKIKKEEDTLLELSGSPIYHNPKNHFSKDSKLIPDGEFIYMIEFFSDLIIDEDTYYQGCFGLNSQYIKDAYQLIIAVEHRAKQIEEAYKDKGVKVTINGLNDGCEKGMAVYVWIPYQ